MGKVTLVGAGPGDVSLLTVRGLEELRTCDAVVYDRLAAAELLCEVPEDCVRIYVGKKPGAHTYSQEEINRILVECAGKYRHVVRLKGGDPFVFGRGGEELAALRAAGIPCEAVPGITSAVAVPELAGIPVTYRGLARSFHVIAGHTEEGMPADEDYRKLAGLKGTLVFLMGLANLGHIVRQLIKYGKSPDTPAAVIEKGATLQARTLRGPLGGLEEQVRAAGVTAPAVIVIGPVAGLAVVPDAVPVYAVGTRRTLEAFRAQIEERGGRLVPLIEMRTAAAAQQQLRREIARIAEYDWVLFASKQAAEQFFAAFEAADADIRSLGGCQFGVIGPGTAGALRERGTHADFAAETADAEHFGRAFAQRFGSERPRVLLPRAVRGNPVLPELLADAGCAVCAPAVYDVLPHRVCEFSVLGEDARIAFFSASGVEAFFAALAESGYKPPAQGRFYCIGPQTKEALFAALAADARGGLPLSEASGAAGEQEAFRERIAAAKEPTAEALARLVTDDLKRG